MFDSLSIYSYFEGFLVWLVNKETLKARETLIFVTIRFTNRFPC